MKKRKRARCACDCGSRVALSSTSPENMGKRRSNSGLNSPVQANEELAIAKTRGVSS